MSIPPTQHWSIAQLGHQHFERGRWADARKIFEGLTVLDASDAYSWHMLGEISRKEGKLDAAAKFFEHCMRLQATDYTHHIAYADVLIQQGNPDAAWQVLGPLRALIQGPIDRWPADAVDAMTHARALMRAHFGA